MEIFIGLGIGLVFFLCTLKAYAIGLQHGKQLINKEVPKVEINPVNVIKKVVDEHKAKEEAKQVQEDLQSLYNYNPYAVKEVDN